MVFTWSFMKKGGMFVFDEVPAWIIALIVLGLMLFLYFILNQKQTGILDYLKNLWRYGS